MTAVMCRAVRPGQNPPMHEHAPAAGIVMGHEVLDLVAARGGRCGYDVLRADAAARFGADAVFGNCHGDRFEFAGLVEFLASKGKLARLGDEVALGQVPGCSGHGHEH